MPKISEIVDNSGSKRNVYVDLKVGDRLLSKPDLKEENFITPNKVYKIKKTYLYDWKRIGYILDEEGQLQLATPEKFDLIKLK